MKRGQREQPLWELRNARADDEEEGNEVAEISAMLDSFLGFCLQRSVRQRGFGALVSCKRLGHVL